jgi:hypothetical protein
MESLQPYLNDLSKLPDWAIPAIGGGCAILILSLGYLIFGKKKDVREAASWHGQPTVRRYERQITRQNEAPRGSDQRQGLRRTGNPIDVQINDLELKGPVRTGMVVDRSLRGLCLAVESPYEVNGIICVRPSGDSSLPWIKVTVKNCRYVGKAYELGCEFVQVPPSNILMLFG